MLEKLPIAKLSTLLRTAPKQNIAAETVLFLRKALDTNQESILKTFTKIPTGFVLTQFWHESRSDLQEHLTVDVYADDPVRKGVDMPIGVIHCYGNHEIAAFDTRSPMSLAAYNRKKAEYDAARGAEATVVDNA